MKPRATVKTVLVLSEDRQEYRYFQPSKANREFIRWAKKKANRIDRREQRRGPLSD